MSKQSNNNNIRNQLAKAISRKDEVEALSIIEKMTDLDFEAYNNDSITRRSIAHEAIGQGLTEVTIELLDRYPNFANSTHHMNPYYDSNILNQAAFYGNETIVDKLLELNPKLINFTEQGESALHRAALSGNIAVFNKLLKTKPRLLYSPNSDNRQNTVLRRAIDSGNVAMVSNLLEKHPDIINEFDNRGILSYAFRSGNETMANKLLEFNPDLSRDSSNRQILFDAVHVNNETMVDKLLARNRDLINAKNYRGESVLYYAVKSNNITMVNKLLEFNPDLIRVQNNNYHTALHCAIEMGNEAMVDKLLNFDPEITNIRDKNGKSVLHYAVEQGNIAIFDKLLKSNPNLAYLTEKNGFTVLHNAPLDQMARHIMERIPDISLKVDEYDRTAADNTSRTREFRELVGAQISKDKARIENEVTSVVSSAINSIDEVIKNFQDIYKREAIGKSNEQLNKNVEGFVSQILEISVKNNLITQDQRKQYVEENDRANLKQDVNKICNALRKSHSNLQSKLYEAVVRISKSLNLETLSKHYETRIQETRTEYLMKETRNVVKNMALNLKKKTVWEIAPVVQEKSNDMKDEPLPQAPGANETPTKSLSQTTEVNKKPIHKYISPDFKEKLVKILEKGKRLSIQKQGSNDQRKPSDQKRKTTSSSVNL